MNQPPETVAIVGSHPLAGGEKAGVKYAQPDLFEGRLTILTPDRHSDQEDVSQISRFLAILGCSRNPNDSVRA